jgi:hypothetical protein
LPIILTVAYFYEQLRRADGEMERWRDGVVGFSKIIHCFTLDQGKRF